jgi:hypothetical protein
MKLLETDGSEHWEERAFDHHHATSFAASELVIEA